MNKNNLLKEVRAPDSMMLLKGYQNILPSWANVIINEEEFENI